MLPASLFARLEIIKEILSYSTSPGTRGRENSCKPGSGIPLGMMGSASQLGQSEHPSRSRSPEGEGTPGGSVARAALWHAGSPISFPQSSSHAEAHAYSPGATNRNKAIFIASPRLLGAQFLSYVIIPTTVTS